MKHFKTNIPIFDVRLEIVVADDIHSARKEREPIYGPAPFDDYCALCSSCGPDYTLFFKPASYASIAIIAHEVFHLTHQILHRTGARFDIDNHEVFAKLHQYLIDLVMGAFSKEVQ